MHLSGLAVTLRYMNETQTPTTATPRKGTVRDAWGDPCARASKESYPLAAKCDYCSATIRCASGDADWAHKRTRRIQCEPER